MATVASATATGFSSSLSGLPDQVLLAHTRSLVLHEQALQLAVLDHLREIQARHLHLRLGFSSLFDYAVHELGYSEGAAWRRIKAMRLCSETAGTRERLQDGSLTLSAAAQLQNTFDLLQRTATAAADHGAAPAAPELLPGGTGTAPEAGASGTAAAAPARPVPALDAAQRQELVAQASGKSTREVKQLLAGVAPELARPADRMRALGDGRWELKVVIDAACQRGIEQLRALLSHVDPHLTLGQLVERLVQDGLQRYDPGRPPRGRRGGRREASAGQAPEPQAQEGPAGGTASPAKRGAQEQPGVPPPPEGTSAGGSTPGAGSAVRRGTRAREWRRRHLGGGSAARAVGGARDWWRQHPGAWQASGGGARHRYFGGEVGGWLRVPRHRTDAAADRRRQQTRACRPRWQRRIAVAALLRQRSGRGRRSGQGRRSPMAVRGRSRRQPARPEAARSRPTGRADPGTFRHPCGARCGAATAAAAVTSIRTAGGAAGPASCWSSTTSFPSRLAAAPSREISGYIARLITVSGIGITDRRQTGPRDRRSPGRQLGHWASVRWQR